MDPGTITIAPQIAPTPQAKITLPLFPNPHAPSVRRAAENDEQIPRPVMLPRSEAAPSRPAFYDSLAHAIKRFEDPVVDKLDRNAYEYIRTTDVVSYPLRKLAMQVSSRVLTVNGDSEQAAALQKSIDGSHGIPELLRWLALYGGPEGMTLFWMKDDVRNNHIVLDCRGGGRHKANAGGVLVVTREYDENTRTYTERVIKQLEDGSVPQPGDHAEEYPRERFVIYRPGGGSNPEGDSELAWQLYLLAHAAQVNDRNWDDFAEKFVLPVWLAREEMGNARPGNSYAKVDSLAQALQDMPQGGSIGMSEEHIVSLLQASNTGPLVMELREKALMARAHKLILHNELTSSAVQGEGRGDTKVARGEQDLVVEAECLAICEALTFDMLSYLKSRLAEAGMLPALKPGEPEPWLSLEPAAEENQLSGAELDAMRASDVVETEWYYEQRGAPRPEGLPDVLEPNKASMDPLAGLGLPGLSDLGGLGQPALPQNRPATPQLPPGLQPQDKTPKLPPGLQPAGSKPILPGLSARQRKVLLTAGETEIDELRALVNAARARLTDLFRDEFTIAAESAAKNTGYLLSEETADMLGKLVALVDLAGRARFFRELKALERRARLAGPSNVEPAVAIQTALDLPFEQAITDFTTRVVTPISEVSAALAPTVAQKVALVYRNHGFTMAKVAERTMLEKVQAKLVEFLQTGDSDRKQFAAWFTETNPDLPDTYADVVFRNNVNTAYSSGRHQQMKDAGDLVGGWQYVTAGDQSVRPAHAALDGKVFPMSRADLMPPLGHNCRCTAIPVERGAATLRSDEIDRVVTKVREIDPQFDHWQRPPGGDVYGN